MSKYYINQHVFVYNQWEYEAVECIIRKINGGTYTLEPVEYRNIPSIYYGLDLYTTKEQCLKQEYEIAQEQVRRNTIKMKELEKQLNELIIKQNPKEIEKELDELKNYISKIPKE